MSQHDIEYHKLLNRIIVAGTDRGDRTGTGTRSLFGPQVEFDVGQHGFPLLTTKKVFFKGIVQELLWFLNGDTNNNTLKDKGVNIWNEWALEDGDLGPIYGKQWRKWQGIDGKIHDQISTVIDQIKNNPNSRRIIVNAWNVADLPDESKSPHDNVRDGKMALAPCHCLFQFYVDGDNLSLKLYQRSADYFLGVPFNIASYALLLHLMAIETGLVADKLILTFGDVHVYNNHIREDIVCEQLKRDTSTPAPSIAIRRAKDIFSYTMDNFEIIDYNPFPAIKAPISI